MTNLPTSPSVVALAEFTARLISAADSPNTRRAYQSDLRAWETWALVHGCAAQGLPIPSDLCLAWLAHGAQHGLSPATLRRRAAWLSRCHRDAGLTSPTRAPEVVALLRGHARTSRHRMRRTAPLTLGLVLSALPELAQRDRAIILVGLITGLRRSELAALTWADVQASENGAVLWVRRSKTDQEGLGRVVGLPRASGRWCPVRELMALRGEAADEDPIFGVSPAAVARAVKRVARLAGEDPRRFGGHSLRAGFASEASRLGVSLASIMAQSGHTSPSIAASYVRDFEADANPAARALVRALTQRDSSELEL